MYTSNKNNKTKLLCVNIIVSTNYSTLPLRQTQKDRENLFVSSQVYLVRCALHERTDGHMAKCVRTSYFKRSVNRTYKWRKITNETIYLPQLKLPSCAGALFKQSYD